jgi:hypothetical protein
LSDVSSLKTKEMSLKFKFINNFPVKGTPPLFFDDF